MPSKQNIVTCNVYQDKGGRPGLIYNMELKTAYARHRINTNFGTLTFHVQLEGRKQLLNGTAYNTIKIRCLLKQPSLDMVFLFFYIPIKLIEVV